MLPSCSSAADLTLRVHVGTTITRRPTRPELSPGFRSVPSQKAVRRYRHVIQASKPPAQRPLSTAIQTVTQIMIATSNLGRAAASSFALHWSSHPVSQIVAHLCSPAFAGDRQLCFQVLLLHNCACNLHLRHGCKTVLHLKRSKLCGS